jgi:uncharacterized cupin superfamily protein
MTAERPAFIGNLGDGLAPFDDGGFPDMGGSGNRLGEKLGLTRIGINYEVTPPGSRTSFPHAEGTRKD